ncbi:hypothetical protein ACWDV7_20610 [Streptomyces sp. NPDC003362]
MAVHQEDLTEFVRSNVTKELETARSMGSLVCIGAALERLAVIERHKNDRIIMLALADRYGGYHLNWWQVAA